MRSPRAAFSSWPARQPESRGASARDGWTKRCSVHDTSWQGAAPGCWDRVYKVSRYDEVLQANATCPKSTICHLWKKL